MHEPGGERAGSSGGNGSRETSSARPRDQHPWGSVPWRTIVGSVLVVTAVVMFLVVLYLASRIVILICVAGFFAVVLSRPVGWLQHRFKLRRGAAIGTIMLFVLALTGGLGALFIMPVRTQLVAVLTDLPGTVKQASEGEGPLGGMVERLNIESLIRDHQDTLTTTAKSVQDSLPGMVGSALEIALSVVTVALMTCLMLSQSSALGRTAMKAVPMRHRDWVATVSVDAAKAVSGYMIGNLIISVCAGVAAFACLFVLGVKSAAVISLWVAFADLIPLVGATIGAIVAVAAALFVSPTAGVIALVYFVLYQQFENSVLQIQIMARTVQVNPLVVLLSVLVGVELFGVVGALLAVPVAGALSVIIKELWRHRPTNGDELIVITHDRFDDNVEDPKRGRYLRWRRRPKPGPVQPPIPP